MGSKYISPGSWFSLEYPAGWHEFEDTDDTFLFYNPDKWNGNFRISASRGDSDMYAADCMKDELRSISGAKEVKVGKWNCIYSTECFQENGVWYATHFFVTGKNEISVECSFTVMKGEPIRVAEEIISSLRIRQKGDKPTREIIPVRVLEISVINEGYDWAVSTIKKKLTKDFTSMASDIGSIQKMIDGTDIDKRQKQPWASFGFAFCAILFNEIDGMEWVTLVDGDKECPALRFRDTDVMVFPEELIWDKVRCGERCDLKVEYANIRKRVEEVL